MDEILNECSANLNNVVGQVTLNFCNKLNSVAEQANALKEVGSSIARRKITEICNFDSKKMMNLGVVYSVNDKNLLENDENNKDNKNRLS